MYVGLTGGIGSGKSTVAKILKNLGAVIIDSDQLAKEVVAPGEAGYEKILAQFGTKILTTTGQIDRAKLADLVFRDSNALQQLNQIVHPLVGAKTNRILFQSSKNIVIHDIPLLYENNLAHIFHLIIVVTADLSLKYERLFKRGLTEIDIKNRLANQASDTERISIADIVISNNSSIEDLKETVTGIFTTRIRRFFTNLISKKLSDRKFNFSSNNENIFVNSEKIIKKLDVIFKDFEIKIIQIGPTSIPDIFSPDLIELQLNIPDLKLFSYVARCLNNLGYLLVDLDNFEQIKSSLFSRWFQIDFEKIFVSADPDNNVNIYVRLKDSNLEKKYLNIRNWFVNHPQQLAKLNTLQENTIKLDENLLKYQTNWFNFLVEKIGV